MKPPVRVAVIYSLPTDKAKLRRFIATDEDTKASALEISAALREKGATATLHPISEKAIANIKNVKADCIFNVKV